MKITFIFCVYNEYNNLKKNLKKTENAILERISNFEIILIDNNSNDGSSQFIHNYASSNMVKIFNKFNMGKGGSTKKAFTIAKGDYLVLHDIDGEYNINDTLDCLNFLISGKNDAIIGTRISKRKYIYFKNYLGAIYLSKLINFLYGSNLSDVPSMPKIFKRKLIHSLSLESNGFDLDFELITKSLKKNASIVEYPVNYFPRSIKEGKKLRAVSDGFKALVRIFKDYII